MARIIVCHRCQSKVSIENVSKGYYAYCPTHDEDLFSFECDFVDV